MARISVEDGDPAFIPAGDLRRHVAQVFLEGEKQVLCLMADEEQGFVRRCVLDEIGSPIIADGEFLTETVEGIVRIDWSGPA